MLFLLLWSKLRANDLVHISIQINYWLFCGIMKHITIFLYDIYTNLTFQCVTFKSLIKYFIYFMTFHQVTYHIL